MSELDFEKLEEDLFRLHNEIRQNPQSFIPKLKSVLTCFKNKIYHIPGEEIRLELIGTFNPEAANSILAIFNAQNEDVIHGQDSDGQDISLFESMHYDFLCLMLKIELFWGVCYYYNLF